MSRIVGIHVKGDGITLVHLEGPKGGPWTVVDDQTMSLQAGDRSAAYAALYDRFVGYLGENKVDQVVIKASALPMAGMREAVLTAAEVRGVVIAASAKSCAVKCVKKASLSRRKNKRTADEYIDDDQFWEKAGLKDLRVGSREAAFLAVESAG